MIPLMLPLRGRAALAATLISAALLALPATSAQAALGVACPLPASHPFAPWGDAAYYAFVPNGGFENGATGWTLGGGARVIAGNEPFSVHAAGDHAALSLPAGSSATSPRMCIGALSMKMRFFARYTVSSDARLKVKVLYDGGLGQLLGIADAGTVSGGQWHPSQAIGMLGGALPLLTQDVRIRFTPADSLGTWAIDDVYVDPLMHR
jgi:hypothetical protein